MFKGISSFFNFPYVN